MPAAPLGAVAPDAGSEGGSRAGDGIGAASAGKTDEEGRFELRGWDLRKDALGARKRKHGVGAGEVHKTARRTRAGRSGAGGSPGGKTKL